MNVDLLLDTHMAIWFLRGDERARPVRDAVGSSSTSVAFSAVSLAEIAIEFTIGKLPYSPTTIRHALLDHDVTELAFTGDHAEALALLPLHHRDPFDRMLIAQARAEEYTIATIDRDFRRYDVPIFDG